VPKSDQLAFVRHKERKFGRGCLDQWRAQRGQLLASSSKGCCPSRKCWPTNRTASKPARVSWTSIFTDVANFLYSGHYRLPAAHSQLARWYQRMGKIKPTI